MNFMISSRLWSKAAALSCLLAGSSAGNILLIEDQGGFGPLADNLRAAGYTVTVRNNEFANNYANLLNQNFLSGYSLVIYGERGNGSGASLPANVGASLEAYLQAGGNLLVTGWDSLYIDAENVTADLVRATSPKGTLVASSAVWNVAADHSITNGPYGNYFGQSFSSSLSYDVSVTPDIAAGAIEVVSTGNPRITGKIIFTDLPATTGSVCFWNGGLSGTTSNAQPEFTDGGNPEAIFRNYVAFIEGEAPGFNGQLAGADIQVGDTDGDGFVTQVLNGSKAAQVIGDIASMVWTLPGGVVLNDERPEVTFPANNTLFTATLTVTDGAGATYVDTVDITVFTKTAGLFTDFADATYSGVDPSTTASRVTGTLEDDTLVIDPIGPGVPDVFRRVAGVWTASPFTETVTDIRAIDDSTLFSGNLATGTDFKVHRLVAGQWITTPLNLSAPPPIVSRFDYAFDPESVVFADLFNNTYGSSGGRVFAYDWDVNDWNHTELLPTPTAGIATDSRWGEEIAVDGDLVAVIRRGTTALGKSLSIFRKSGATWNLEDTIGPNLVNTLSPDYFSGALAIGNGVVVTAQEGGPAGNIYVHEKIAESWQQIRIPLQTLSPEFNRVLGVDVDDDGLSFAAKDSVGNFLLYQRDPGVAGLIAFTTRFPRRLPLADLHADPNLTGITFSGGEIVVSDPVSGVVRIFDKDVPFDTVNAAPNANAGEDIATTSFDGQPVGVFLNGGGTTDANYDEILEAEWTWEGGSASGLFTFALIDPAVTSVELKVTDIRGAVSRDTVAVNIDAPPVVDPGDDVIVVDSDGDGAIRVNVSATLQSSEYPVSAWSWSWPGGIFSGQSGTLTLGAAANGQPVTLTAIDVNGLSSQTSFGFSMLASNPAPVILQPTGGGPTDNYGAAAAIQNGVALIGAPTKPYSGSVTGASYLAQNLNGLWPQIQLAPGMRQGDAVLVEGDFAFVGAKRGGAFFYGYDPGAVVIYKKSPTGWLPHQTLDTPLGATTFGASLAASGNQLLVGAPQSQNPENGAGAAFLYELSGSSWDLVRRFDPPTPVEQGRFGTRVAIAGEVIAISQPRFATPSSVVMFEKVSGSWTFETEFLSNTPSPPTGNEQYHFGQGLGLSESELLIGSPVEGVVYRRTRVAGDWGAASLIDPNRYFFGSSIAMKNDVAVVGSVLENVGLGGAIPGSVTSLILRNGTWQESGYLKLTSAIDPFIQETPNFSAAVSFDGRDLIVGAPTARNSGGVKSGKAYIYRNFAGLNPNANYEPVADADVSEDNIIDVADSFARSTASPYPITEPLGSEQVTLNASNSTDQENAIASYVWTWPGGTASGVTANVRFPVGTTVVTLTVTDNKGIVNSDTVNVIVTQEQISPNALPATTGNTLTVNLPVPGAKWRLSSEFDWHASGHTITQGIVANATYRLEMLAYPGSPDILSEVVQTEADGTTTLNPSMDAPSLPAQEGIIGFPENAEGFGWRLAGETTFRNLVDNNDSTADFSDISLPLGSYNIEFLPVAGFATPPSRLVNVVAGTTHFTSSGYQQLASYDLAKTFDQVVSPQQLSAPHHFTGMIRTRLGRGSGTAVAERVVLTAAHLFFDDNGLAFQEVEWFPQQQQGAHQAPPVAPRGILFRTSYAKLVAPNTVPDAVENLPDDDQEVDYAVLYFSTDNAWPGGEAGFLESSSDKNWLAGTEPKLAVAYPQRSQPFPVRGKLFQKNLLFPLTPLDANAPAKLNSTDELSGDGGASGSALFVQPAGTSKSYPAAILLAGQGRAVYRIIDQDVTRMIKDGEDAASGNDEVLDNNASLVGFGGLGGFTTLAVDITPTETLNAARWTITPDVGNAFTNLMPGARVAFNSNWQSFTVSFSSVPGYAPPQPLFYLKKQVNAGAANTYAVAYQALTGYELWKEAESITSDQDDRDGDGKNALIEYAINGDPDGGSDPAPIRMAAVPSQTTHAEYEVYVSSTADKIRYVVKASNTLPPTNVITLQTFTKTDGTNGYLRVTDSQAKIASPKRFAWVEYTHDRTIPAAP